MLFLIMQYDSGRMAGLLLFVGSVVCVLGIIVAEALYPGYSTSEDYISDLGVGPSALVFNSSVFLLGVMVVCSAYFVQKTFNFKPLSLVAAMAGVGTMGVGLFTEDSGGLHGAFSLIAFLFGGIAPIVSSKVGKPPFSYLSVVLGGMSLVALVLFALRLHLGLGVGGMERMIAYPDLLWAIGFGGQLMGGSEGVGARS